MANNPITESVFKWKGTGAVLVSPLLPTRILGTQDGSDVGTGGPGLAAFETTAPAGNFIVNRNIEFLDDRYALGGAENSAGSGVYKKGQGGAGLWGRVQGGGANLFPNFGGHCSGLHVLHPAGVPTLAYLLMAENGQFLAFLTTDGTTGAAWVAGSLNIGSANPVAGSTGMSLVFRDSIVWAHSLSTGAGGTITQYNFALGARTTYNSTNVLDGNNLGCSYALHVHGNVLFLAGWSLATGLSRVTKLQAGSFVTVVTDSTQIAGNGADVISFTGHNALFTDFATGDLIWIQAGLRVSNLAPRAQVFRIQNAVSGSPTPSDISSTVMGAVEGADKYLEGGGSANRQRRWAINIDTQSDPGTPRTFLTTWVAGGGTETWEWKGVGAEMEAVALLAGISDDFALPYNTVGGGERSPRIAAVEIGDVANPTVEVAGGTKIFFRGRGVAAAGTLTFYGTDSEGTPSTVVPISAFVVVSGGSGTPSQSGNTIIDFEPDNGVTLYSVVLDTGAAGVDIGEGDVGLIIPDFV